VTIRWVLSDILLSNLYWRNTKDNVLEDEFQIPDCETDLVLIDFHNVERTLYEDVSTKGEFAVGIQIQLEQKKN
jgi:hypothetical protein